MSGGRSADDSATKRSLSKNVMQMKVSLGSYTIRQSSPKHAKTCCDKQTKAFYVCNIIKTSTQNQRSPLTS